MENKIYAIESPLWKSLAITEDELWLSSNKVKSLIEFGEATQKTGVLKSAYAYRLSSISEVSFNQASESVKIKYLNDKGKEKKVEANFGDKEQSNAFGEYLGTEVGLVRDEEKENKTKYLLFNLLYLAITLGATYFLATIDDTSELTNTSSRRSRNRGAFIKLIVDILGQKGVIAMGSFIALYIIYQLYKRFTNPAKEILFSKR